MSDAPGSAAAPAAVTSPEADAAAAGRDAVLRQLSGPVGALASAGYSDAALRLIRERGGGRIYVPRRPAGVISGMIGVPALEALIGITDGGGVEIDVPPRSTLTETAKAGIIAAADGGMTTLEIARKLGLCERHVRRIRNDAGCAPAPGGVKQKRRRRADQHTIDIEDWLADHP